MTLTIDIGNTRTKVGVFDANNQLIKKENWETLTIEKITVLQSTNKIRNVIYSSVNNVPKSVVDFLQKQFYCIELTAQTPLPIQNKYKSPNTLGKDRLAAVVGAFELYPYENTLVIDAGTCITYDFINDKGDYLGGNICPGINMRLKAMHQFTARLPLVKRNNISTLAGYNTESALLIGAQNGAVLEMDGFIQQFQAVFKVANTILTGGDADYFINNLKNQIFVNQNLVLLGLNKIIHYNVGHLE